MNSGSARQPSGASIRKGIFRPGRLLAAILIVLFVVSQAPLPVQAAPDTSPTASGCSGHFYRVKSGDTLYSIARHNGVSVQRLQRANGIPNPHRIYVGQWLCIPSGRPHPKPPQNCTAGSTGCHTVQKGETLFSIARLYGTTVQCLLTINNIPYPNVIYGGQTIRIGYCSG